LVKIWGEGPYISMNNKCKGFEEQEIDKGKGWWWLFPSWQRKRISTTLLEITGCLLRETVWWTKLMEV